MKTSFNKESVLLFIILIPVYFTFSGLFLYENAPKNLQAIIIVSLTVSIYRFGLSHVKQQLVNNKILWAISLFILYGLFQNHLHGFSNGIIKTFSILILYFSIVPLHCFYNIRKKLLNLSLVASVCSLIYFYQQDILLHRGRIDWGIGVLHYTIMSAWLACFALHKLTTSKEKKVIIKSIVIISISSFLIVETQARATFLALASITTGYFYFLFIRNKKNTLYFMFFLLLSSILLTKIPTINERINETKHEIALIKQGHMQSSMGLRIQMWKAAGYIISKNPTIGVGREHYNIKSELSKRNIIDPIVVNIKHYHNGYIDILVKSGVIGLLFIIYFLSYPIYVWCKNKRIEYFPCLSIGLLYIISSLTNIPLNNLHLVFFFMIISWVYNSEQLVEKQTTLLGN